jgi:riboflavin synthase
VFTGLVEEVGELRSVTTEGGTSRLTIGAEVVIEDAKIGDSIAINGCCLTVVEIGPGWYAADAVAETLSRTNLGVLAIGDPVNLERPVRLSDHMGGHLVQGHVDAVGTVVHPVPDLRIAVPPSLLRYLVVKGSVTVDGCSLTIVEVFDDGFSVAIIPHTSAVTTLGRRKIGDVVNLEADVIAKYVERLLAAGAVSPYASDPTPSPPSALP